MKQTFVMLLLLGIAFHCGAGTEPDFRLELEPSARSPRVGDSTKLKLKIIGNGVSDIMKATEGIIADRVRDTAFVCEFEFKPKREGRFTFGPYLLTVNGQKLTSNQLSIDVLPKWSGQYGTFFRVDRNSIVLGETVEVIVETWAKRNVQNTFHLDTKESFICVSSSSGGSSSTGPEGELTCGKQSWVIRPKQAGEFRITRELLREFPEDVTPPNISIMVKEPAQQSVGR